MDRVELHKALVDILGSSNVYFQPPQSVRMKFPCIVYSKENLGLTFADDFGYKFHTRYKIIAIYSDPDSRLVYDILTKLPMCSHDSHYVADNLYHDALTLYTT